jgi:subtilisin family serine protease
VPDDDYDNFSGTSMAAPEVTGAFAMISAIDPTLSPNDILNLLKDTGVLVTDTRLPNPAGAVTGHVKPRIQLDAAVASLTEPPSVSLTSDAPQDEGPGDGERDGDGPQLARPRPRPSTGVMARPPNPSAVFWRTSRRMQL